MREHGLEDGIAHRFKSVQRQSEPTTSCFDHESVLGRVWNVQGLFARLASAEKERLSQLASLRRGRQVKSLARTERCGHERRLSSW